MTFYALLVKAPYFDSPLFEILILVKKNKHITHTHDFPPFYFLSFSPQNLSV